jgi:hypothetical protein
MLLALWLHVLLNDGTREVRFEQTMMVEVCVNIKTVLFGRSGHTPFILIARMLDEGIRREVEFQQVSLHQRLDEVGAFGTASVTLRAWPGLSGRGSETIFRGSFASSSDPAKPMMKATQTSLYEWLLR